MAEAKTAPPPSAAPQSEDVDVRAVVLIGIALGVIVVFCVVAVLGARAWLGREQAQMVGPFTGTGVLQQFALPRLEASPPRNLAALKQEKAQKLHQYRWIDRARGVVQIPIERAIELQLQRAGSGSNHEAH